MSYVTDVILTCNLCEEGDDPRLCPAIEKINAWLMSENYGLLNRVDDYAGGKKAMQAVVYLGAFNYLDLKALTVAVMTAPWEIPEAVCLLVKEEWSEGFHFVRGIGDNASPDEKDPAEAG